MGKKAKKEDVVPETLVATISLPSRGRLLNQWAALQDKLRRLSQQVEQTKYDLRLTAQNLYDVYGVVVQDSKTTVVIQPTATPTVPTDMGETTDDDGKPLKLLRPEDNPLARSPIPIISEPTTGPMSENDVAAIRQASEIKGENPDALRGNLANQFDRAVRLGLGKK